jgi:amino acid transporter
MSDYAEHPELPPARTEKTDVSPRAIIIGLVLVTVVAGLLALLCIWLFPTALKDSRARVGAAEFPAPRLQATPAPDMATFYAEEMQRLHGAGWVDRAQGIVHIPIEDAMRAIAARGIPDWPKTAPARITR